MFPWAAKGAALPKENVRENCTAVWAMGGDEESEDKNPEDPVALRFRNKPAVVISRFHRNESRAYRNLVMRSKRVVTVLSGEFIGVSHNMKIERSKNTPEWVAVGACTFTDGKKAYEWMDSDPNFMGNDLLSHSHEAWLLRLNESDNTKDGFNVWFLNNVFCDRSKVPEAVKAVNTLKENLYQRGARLVINNNDGVRVRGSSTQPHYVILFQFKTFDSYYDWLRSDDGNRFESTVNTLGSREALLFALCPDFPTPEELKEEDELRRYIKMQPHL